METAKVSEASTTGEQDQNTSKHIRLNGGDNFYAYLPNGEVIQIDLTGNLWSVDHREAVGTDSLGAIPLD